MADASLVMIYLDDLTSPMVFSSSVHPSPSKILYTPERAAVNTADQVPDPADLYSWWLDPLISMVLFMYEMSPRQAPGSLLQIATYLSQNAYYQVSWGNKRNFVPFDSFFFPLDLLRFSDWWWKWHFVLPEMYWIISLALTGIKNAILESLFKVHSFWYFWISSSKEIKLMIGCLNWESKKTAQTAIKRKEEKEQQRFSIFVSGAGLAGSQVSRGRKSRLLFTDVPTLSRDMNPGHCNSEK